jgi:hypothetical protein
MVVAAATFSEYWNFNSTGYISVFYFLAPILMVAVNWMGVFVSYRLLSLLLGEGLTKSLHSTSESLRPSQGL